MVTAALGVPLLCVAAIVEHEPPLYLAGGFATGDVAGAGAAGSEGPGAVWDLDGSGLSVGRICHRSPTPEPVLDTHWCDRYERVGSPR